MLPSAERNLGLILLTEQFAFTRGVSQPLALTEKLAWQAQKEYSEQMVIIGLGKGTLFSDCTSKDLEGELQTKAGELHKQISLKEVWLPADREPLSWKLVMMDFARK